MKTRLEELEGLISENDAYMASVYELIRLQKSDDAARGFVSNLLRRIEMEKERSGLVGRNP